jgi:peptide-methionine (S)-S-oxide reductase
MKTLHLKSKTLLMVIMGMSLLSCANQTPNPIPTMTTENTTQPLSDSQYDTATFGAGCFWCVEAVFLELEGVVSVTSGYAGGTIKNPTYKEVCSGLTGHAEVCRIVYAPKLISFTDLLQAFWLSHNPTTLNQQGNDIGTQYRSVIFYHNAQQKELAERKKQELEASHAFADPIVTEISALPEFYKAEDYHQNYYNQNGDQPYCMMVVKPKVEKFRKVFKDKLKHKEAH